MAVSMVFRLSSSHPLPKNLIYRAFGPERFKFGVGSFSLLRRSTVLSFCSNSSTAESIGERKEVLGHRWPEWETFVGMLKDKGHFGEEDSGLEGDVDFNRMKNACLMFARDRFDLLRLNFWLIGFAFEWVFGFFFPLWIEWVCWIDWSG